MTVALAAAPGVIEKSKPLPVSATACGLFPALSVILSVPVLVPPAVGLKKTPIVQFKPGATGLVQLLSTPKSAALAVTAVIVSVTLPVFVTVSVCGNPDVPTNWEGKEMLAGLRDSAALILVPAREICCGLPPTLSVMVTAALF